MKGLTREQLEAMGAVPVVPQEQATTTTKKGLTLQELEAMGATPKTEGNSNVPAVIKATNPQMANEATFEYNKDDSTLSKGAKAVGNLPKSVFNIGKGIVTAVAHPVDTVTNVGKLVAGTAAVGAEKLIENTAAGQKFLEMANESRKSRGLPELKRDENGNLQAEDTEEMQMAKAVGGYFAERYGGVENIKKTLVEDPAGIALDASMLLSGGSTLAAKGAKVSELAGAARTVNVLNKTAKVAKVTSEAIDPIRITSKYLAPVVKNKAQNINNLITKTGEELKNDAITKGIESLNQNLKGVKNTFEKSTFKITDDAGNVKQVTPIDTMREYKLTPEVKDGKVNVDNIKQSISDNLNSLDDKISETILKNNRSVPVIEYEKMLEDAIKNTNESKFRQSILREKIQSDIARLKKEYPEGVPIDELNKIRIEANRDFDPATVDVSRIRGNGAREVVYNTTDDQIVKSYLLEQRKLINVKDFAKRLENHAVKGGRLGNMFWTTIGALLGKSFDVVPVAGPIVGAAGGRALSGAIQARQFRSLPADIKAGLEAVLGKSLTTDTSKIPAKIKTGLEKLKVPKNPGNK